MVEPIVGILLTRARGHCTTNRRSNYGPDSNRPVMPTSSCEFRSAARVGTSGHGWPYSGNQGLVIIVGPTVVVSVLLTLAANIGNQRCARPSAQLWRRLELTVGPTLANCFRWPWQFSRPTSGPWLNQSSAYYQLDSVAIARPTVGPTMAQTRTDCRANLGELP